MYKDNTYLREFIFQVEQKITIRDIELAQHEIGVPFPNEYVNFMLYSNGGEGDIGESYLVIWSLQEVLEFYDISCREYMPELIVIASDGASQGFAIDTRKENNPIVAIPLDSTDYRDVRFCAETFDDFLKYLYNYTWD